ncbi:Uridine_kinase [Hexamita inflata]|uniref:Uridine kinase n=1 Tax=Hexamita inflata TaxID=28002 RepID=A0AA86R2T9_9EUKA|nr:Uridine kinase [Hexamita inflata]CAI9965569.1 Uridine kinase [Hexamita inflata]CAI9969390.1 Uridine kinase [Hexamita inflata]
MNKKVTITTSETGKPLVLDSGLRIYDIITKYPDAFPVHPQGLFPVAATINNLLVALSDKVSVNCSLNMIYADSVIGGDVYRRSLVFILGMAWFKVFPKVRLEISHSIGHAFYFVIKNEEADVKQVIDVNDVSKVKVTQEHFDGLKLEMEKIIAADIPILSRTPMNNQHAIDVFCKQNQPFTCSLLQSRNETRIIVQQCGEYIQLAHGPLVGKTGSLNKFNIAVENDMLVLIYPSHKNSEVIPEFKHNAPLSQIYEEYGHWAGVMDIESIGQLNAINRTDRFKSYVQICESRQNQMLSQVCELIMKGHKSMNGPMAITEALKYNAAQESNGIMLGDLTQQTDQIKLVAISGPSSSGKTTFAKKLQYNLTVMGRTPLVLSMDNYFVNREVTPLGEDGKYDFEHLEAIDIDYFNVQLAELLNGKQIQMPIFDFKTGQRSDKTVPMVLPSRGIVIIEGIHALNPIMTRSVPMNDKFCIFIQPLPCINLDDRTRISTRDYRLFRRIVRDKKYRNCSAEHTIQLFINVRKGEDKWIYPHQNRADIYFNTALDYELLVLSTFVTPLLHDISPESPSYMEARRLLSFLDWIQAVNADYVPKHSILREFIGGSGFAYD